ncbi:DNA replication protein [Porphyromonas cangingivalis]|nr:DNA replication protein [Porphyromonas cangingivalis]
MPSHITIDVAEEYLWVCYEHEVKRRGGELVRDVATIERMKLVAMWLIQSKRPWILMYGMECGTGKTTFARAICSLMNYFYDNKSPYPNLRTVARQVTAIDLCKSYIDDKEQYRRYAACDTLFIDDMGIDPASVKDFGNEYSPLLELLYKRYDNRRTTIITSNISDTQIRERYGARIDDRLREVCAKINFQGESYRK